MEEIEDYYTRYRRTFDRVGYVNGVDGTPQLSHIEPKDFNGLAAVVGNKPIPILWYDKKSKTEEQMVVVLLPLSTLETTVSAIGKSVDDAKRELIPQLRRHPELVVAHMGFFNNPTNYMQFITK